MRGTLRTFRAIRKRRGAPGNRGFTLIEIAIVLGIVAILSTLAVTAYIRFIDQSRVKQTIANIRLMEQAIKRFEFDNMRLPNSLNELGPIAILNDKGNTVTQSPPFLDAYGNTFQYLNFANEPPGWPHCRRDGVDKPLSLDYDLFSMGADGVSHQKLNHANSRDDIVRARSGAFVDLASKY